MTSPKTSPCVPPRNCPTHMRRPVRRARRKVVFNALDIQLGLHLDGRHADLFEGSLRTVRSADASIGVPPCQGEAPPTRGAGSADSGIPSGAPAPARSAVSAPPIGRQRRAFVGPKTTTPRAPTAPARWLTPLSLPR